MNKARAMLDALMGPGRDVAEKDRANDEFKKSDVCKHYLCGICPNAMVGKKLTAILADPSASGILPGSVWRTGVINIEGCHKSHCPGFKNQLNEHPESAKYKEKYERELQEFLRRLMRECENRIIDERRKVEAGKLAENDHCKYLICEVCGMTYKQLKKKINTEAREGLISWAMGDQKIMPGDWKCSSCGTMHFARQEKCTKCGADRPAEALAEATEAAESVWHDDTHAETEIHAAYVKLRAKLDELNEKWKDKEPAPDEKKSKSRDRRDDRSRRDRDRSRSRGRRRQEGAKDSKEQDGKDDKDDKASEGGKDKKEKKEDSKKDDASDAEDKKDKKDKKKEDNEDDADRRKRRRSRSGDREPRRSGSRPRGSRGRRNDSRSRGRGGHGRRHDSRSRGRGQRGGRRR